MPRRAEDAAHPCKDLARVFAGAPEQPRPVPPGDVCIVRINLHHASIAAVSPCRAQRLLHAGPKRRKVIGAAQRLHPAGVRRPLFVAGLLRGERCAARERQALQPPVRGIYQRRRTQAHPLEMFG